MSDEQSSWTIIKALAEMLGEYRNIGSRITTRANRYVSVADQRRLIALDKKLEKWEEALKEQLTSAPSEQGQTYRKDRQLWQR